MSRVTRFTLLYVAAFTAFCAAGRDRRVVAYLVVLGVCAAIAWRAHRTASFSGPLRWALSLGGLMHLAGGLLPSPQDGSPIFYETWLIGGVLKYDQVVHYTVSAILTVACWQLIGVWVDERRCGPVAQAMVAVLMALGGGAANEAFEFASSLRFADAYVGGLTNAGWDLVFNAFGAVTAAVWLAIQPPAAERSPETILSRTMSASALASTGSGERAMYRAAPYSPPNAT